MAKGDEQTAAAIVAAARGPKKITTPELIHGLCSEFMELHGDRGNGDDQAVIGGIGVFNQQPVTLIATDKGTSAEERIAKNFGSPLPAGYRKARRLIMQAAKFHRPVITLVNTSGAYPGQAAEENGQGEAIARNLLELSTVPVPMITIIFGEGGSGGALALACGDEVWMLENSMYSVLSPEGFASILWKDSMRSAEAAELLQLTPQALLKQQVIEGIIPEPGSHKKVVRNIADVLKRELPRLQRMTTTELLEQRKQRYRKF